MKKSDVFVIMLLLGCISLRAQTIKTIVFDFSTKTITNITDVADIKEGDYISVQIKNFNPYLYQAQIAFTDSNIAINSAPTLFSSYFNTADLSSLVANLGSTALKVFPGATAPGAAGFVAVPVTKAQFNANMAIKMEDLKGQLISAQVNLDKLIQDIQAFIFTEDIRMLVVKQWHIKAGDVVDFTPAEQAKFIQDLKRYIARKNMINSDLITNLGTYESQTLLYGKYIRDDDQLKIADSLLKISSKDLFTALSSFDTTYAYSKFENMLSQLTNLQNVNFEYTSFPTQIKADITHVDVDISPWMAASNLSSYKASWQFPLAPASYFNFSTDFYISGLHNDTYFANQKINGTDTSYIIDQENSSKVEVGISALFHYGFYVGKSKNTSLQVCFGPGISIQKSPQPRLLLGIGTGFGRKNKFILSVGIIAGEVQQLRSYYKSTPVVTFSPTDLTVGVLKANAFFSIGYAIF